MHQLKQSVRMWPYVAGVLGLLVPVTVPAQNPWVDPRSMPIPELHAIPEIHPQRVQLKNGMVVYFLEDHDFPIVDVQARIRAGGIYDPPEKVGLADLTGTVMRSGGSTKINGDALDEKLESMGASVEVGIGDTDGTASASSLTRNFDETLRLFAQVLRDPAFPQDKIDLAKKQERTSIASRNDEHLNISFRELRRLVYGKDHPYARQTEYATIDAITRDDLVAFHDTYFHPDRIIMTVYGDFDTKKVQKLLGEIFGDWTKSKTPLPPDPKVGKTEAHGLFFANKSDVTNSVILVGHESMRQDNPDYPAMAVFHEIMGGGFSSRLFNEIRTRRGLAYATGSFLGAGLHHPGAQGFYVLTQNDSTRATLGYLRAEIQRGLTEKPTEEELKRAKDSMLNSLVFTLSSKGAVLNRMAAYEYYGYPVDFLTTFQKSVRAVTADEVLAAAKRNIRLDGMVALVVGDKAGLKPQLDAMGPMTEIDISIPEPGGQAARPAGSDADFARGQELLAAALAASGGDALAKLADLTVEESGSLTMQGMELQISSRTQTKFPDCERTEQKLPMGTVTQCVCGNQGWMDVMQGPQDMPAEAMAQFQAEHERQLWNVLTGHATMKLQALPGDVDVEGHPAYAVFVPSDRVKDWTIYLDKETHRVVRMDYRDRGMTGGPVRAKDFFEDYRQVDKFWWPYRHRIVQDDAPLATLTVTSVKANTGLTADTFKKP
jgi:zinc protease